MYEFVTIVKAPEFTRPLESQRCQEEETVKFTCEVNKAGVDLTWIKDGTLLVPSEGIRIESEGTTHRLIIDKAELYKAGTYTAMITRDVQTTAELVVLG